MVANEHIRSRVDSLHGEGCSVLATHKDPPSHDHTDQTLDFGQFAGWKTRAIVCLEDLFGKGHTYVEDFKNYTKYVGTKGSANAGIQILAAVLSDIDSGYVEGFRKLIAAGVFADFLSQAEHLLEQGYVAPSASLAGAVLEQGLSSIAKNNEITVRVSDELSALNQKLADAGVYNRLKQKEVSLWIDIRNNATHKEFGDVKEEDARKLIEGAQSFLGDYL